MNHCRQGDHNTCLILWYEPLDEEMYITLLVTSTLDPVKVAKMASESLDLWCQWPWEFLMPTWLEGTISQLCSPHPAIVYFPAVLLHQTRLLNRAISAFHSCHLINGLDRLMDLSQCDLSLNYWDGRLEKGKENWSTRIFGLK